MANGPSRGTGSDRIQKICRKQVDPKSTGTENNLELTYSRLSQGPDEPARKLTALAGLETRLFDILQSDLEDIRHYVRPNDIM